MLLSSWLRSLKTRPLVSRRRRKGLRVEERRYGRTASRWAFVEFLEDRCLLSADTFGTHGVALEEIPTAESVGATYTLLADYGSPAEPPVLVGGFDATGTSPGGSAVTLPAVNGVVYSNMEPGNGYIATTATSGVIGDDDYDSINNASINFTEFRFIGGVGAANQVLEFEFFDTNHLFINEFFVQFNQGGNFVWTITFSSPVTVPDAGFLQLRAATTSTGTWYHNDFDPTIGTTDDTLGSLPTGSNFKFELINQAPPSPAGVTIAQTGGTTDVAEGGATDSYTLVLDSQPTADVTITVDPDPQLDLGSGAGVATTKVFTSTNWNTPQAVTVRAVDDATVEGAHTGTITHSAASTDPNYNGISIQNLAANIADNDSAADGAIQGLVWEDVDGDGVQDTDEGPLANWEVYLDLDNDGVKEPGEPVQVTAADGTYGFTGLTAGTYVVREVVQAGWEITYPVAPVGLLARDDRSSSAAEDQAASDTPASITVADIPDPVFRTAPPEPPSFGTANALYFGHGLSTAPVAEPTTFTLHSNPGADYTIYLDFDGHATTGTIWNTTFNSGNSIISPAYDPAGDGAAFNAAELTLIERIWRRVAEDFMPFNVNVTTEDPGVEALRKTAGDTQWGARVVITGDQSWYSDDNNGQRVGGIAYLGSFQWDSDTPGFVFNVNENGVAEAATHEAGHMLGLSHDGTSTQGYYAGHGSGATSWGPVMGAAYNVNVVQWSKGEYPDANNREDDLAIITDPALNGAGFGYSGLSYRVDDHGGSVASASALNVEASGNIADRGIIERNTDVDALSFTTSGGQITLNVNPDTLSPNLDVLAQLLDSAGNVLQTSRPAGNLSATISASLAAGTYYLTIDGDGEGNLTTGYSDYGSLGQYTISGTIGGFDSGTKTPGDGFWTVMFTTGTEVVTGVDFGNEQTATTEVTVAVAPASVAEDGTGTLVYTFTRTGDTSAGLTVSFAVGGTAAFNTDYTQSGAATFSATSGTVVILAGNSTATVTLDPIADSTAEPDETGILTVTAGTGYSVGTPAGATGTITNDDSSDNPALVDVRVIPVAAPSAEGSTSLPGEISSTAIGSTYYVEIWIQEHSADFNGIAGGQVDFRYTTGTIDARAVVNKDFDVLKSGTIDDPNGLVNDLGGGTLGSGRGNEPAWARLAYVEVSATAPGEATFSLAQGGLQFSLVAGGNVAWTNVDLSDTAVVSHGGAGSRLDLRVVRSETVTDAQGEIAALPADEVWLHEWEPFWVEVWASTPNSASVGVTGGTLDLSYNTAVMTATRIEYGPSFDQFQTGTLNDVAGIVDNLGAGTLRTNVGDDNFVLLARVRFEPAASDQVVVDEVNHSIGPAALNLSLSDATVALVGVGNTTPELPPSPATEMFAVIYDIDDNDAVDFGDFSFFATAFGQTAGGTEPPYTWWADYDKSGTVDLGDFSFFTPAFGKAKPSDEIVFPANYPDAWRPVGGGALFAPNAAIAVDVERAAQSTSSRADTTSRLLSLIATVSKRQNSVTEVWGQKTGLAKVTPGSVHITYGTTQPDATDLDHGRISTTLTTRFDR